MFSQEILFALLISVIASATNTDLANNTNFLLLLLLALAGLPDRGRDRDRFACCNPCCNSSPRLFV